MILLCRIKLCIEVLKNDVVQLKMSKKLDLWINFLKIYPSIFFKLDKNYVNDLIEFNT